MSTMIFPLRNVPESEAQAIRDLLDQEEIIWYETSAGNWGISNHALWINDDTDTPRARHCIDRFQRQLSDSAAQQTPESLLTHLKKKPLTTILALVGAAIIIYFSISPFLSILN